jgi:hypothetical protein
MKVTLDTALAIAQLISLVIILPTGAFKAWRKIDMRLTSQDTKLARIEYALFNEGRGMEQQLKEVHRNQQAVITDLAVLKAKSA